MTSPLSGSKPHTAPLEEIPPEPLFLRRTTRATRPLHQLFAFKDVYKHLEHLIQTNTLRQINEVLRTIENKADFIHAGSFRHVLSPLVIEGKWTLLRAVISKVREDSDLKLFITPEIHLYEALCILMEQGEGAYQEFLNSSALSREEIEIAIDQLTTSCQREERDLYVRLRHYLPAIQSCQTPTQPHYV